MELLHYNNLIFRKFIPSIPIFWSFSFSLRTFWNFYIVVFLFSGCLLSWFLFFVRLFFGTLYACEKTLLSYGSVFNLSFTNAAILYYAIRFRSVYLTRINLRTVRNRTELFDQKKQKKTAQ